MPVLMLGRHVAGVVTEGDLIAAQAKRLTPWSGIRKILHGVPGNVQHPGLTAADLMTSPAITIHPDATISSAAKLMFARHISRLPVVDTDGKLLGIIARRNLLKLCFSSLPGPRHIVVNDHQHHLRACHAAACCG